MTTSDTPTGAALRSATALRRAGRVALRRGVGALSLALFAAYTALPSAYVGGGEGAQRVVPVSAMHTLEAGGLERSWLEIAPPGRLSASTPIVVVLSGIDASLQLEVDRDQLVPFVAERLIELVYPVGLGESWNAGGCCGVAAALDIDDVGFVEALVRELDPHRLRPLDLVGFSNGGRLAYTLACTEPALFQDLVVVMAVPMPGCVVTRPITILQVDGTADPWVPFQAGDPGIEQPAATTEVSLLRQADRCNSSSRATAVGSLYLLDWNHCARGTRVAFAAYDGRGHLWPEGNPATPSGARVIWSFLTDTRLVA